MLQQAKERFGFEQRLVNCVIAFWCVAGPLAPGLPLAHCCQVSGGAWVKAGWVCPGPVLRQVGALACLSCAAGIARPLKYTHLLGTLMHGRCRLGSMQSQRHPFLGAPRHGAVGLARLRRCCGVSQQRGQGEVLKRLCRTLLVPIRMRWLFLTRLAQ